MKKAAKSLKTAQASKKALSVKLEKNKKEPKQVKKTLVKKVTKDNVKNKLSAKKTDKPIKKAGAGKKEIAVREAKTVKKVKITTKKEAFSFVNRNEKKAIKPGKKTEDIKPDSKNIEKNLTAKEEKRAANAPLLLVEVDTGKVDKIEKAVKIKDKPSKSKRGRKPKNKDEDEPEILHDELVEQLIRSTKKLRSQPKKTRILQTFTNPRASLSVVLPDNYNKKTSGNPKKEPKGKFELEYVVRTSTGILYEFLTTPSGLSEWFADNVNIQDGIFTFFWDGSEQKAKLLSFKEDKHVRFQWFDKPDGTYFEFRIERDELTGDISLLIVDFADEVTEMKTSKLLWDSQINKLLHVLGSY